MIIPKIQLVKHYLLQLQNRLCCAIEQEDGASCFQEDCWQHESASGGGRTRVLMDGRVFERAGVNFSHVQGSQLPAAASKDRPDLVGLPFEAVGVSVVIHPQNPYIPTTHANVRFFCINLPTGEDYWWFGGGYDLTPYYGFEEDCRHWHQTAKAACDPFDPELYGKLKQACDQYFYLPHRQEARGIGGLWFDDWRLWEFEQCFSFLVSVGDSFWLAYQPIVARRKHQVYGSREQAFQWYRRGRYVEFNLIYDRGTLFGLQFGGRTESILMSLPPNVTWRYQWQPEPNTPEARLYTDYLVPRDWV